jgi:hypothetical protein
MNWTLELWDYNKFIIFNRIHWRIFWYFIGKKPNHLTLPEKLWIKHFRKISDPLGIGTIGKCLERSGAGIHDYVTKRMESDEEVLEYLEATKEKPIPPMLYYLDKRKEEGKEN